MKGGFLDSLESTLNSWGSKISEGASSAYNKTKNAVTGLNSSTTPVSLPTTVGGRTRKNRRGGSLAASKSVTGLAAHSASVSNLKTAQPHNVVGGSNAPAMKPSTGLAHNSSSDSNLKTPQPHKTVGGKSRRHRKHKHSKSHKHYKH
jgi:hypothetical protein